MNDLLCIVIGCVVICAASAALFGVLYGGFWLCDKLGKLTIFKAIGTILIFSMLAFLSVLVFVASHDIGCHLRGHDEHSWVKDKK